MDSRVINKLGLESTYAKYEFLMDSSNYTKKNIELVCSEILKTPNGLKSAVFDKIKSMVISGDISDTHVVRALEKNLRIDLMTFI